MKTLNKVTVFAPAKVNLFLHVIGKTSNNYHLLQSLVYFADFGDEIVIEENDNFVFENTGIQIPAQNSVIEAAKKLSDILQKPLDYKITLNKKIPMGAGLGGGSSDAAATIKALLKFWGTQIEQDALQELLISLGADVPSCYMTQACYFEGIGEHITPLLHAPQLYAVLCNPNKHSDTGEIFKHFANELKAPISLPDSFYNIKNLTGFLKTTENDLTSAACKVTPDIADILQELANQDGVLLSRMSGSGSTCFALLETKKQALELEIKLRHEHPHWWSKAIILS